MDLGLKEKTAIVTGGGSNIGRAIVLTLAREGANVVIADIDETQGKKVEAQANALSGRDRALLVRTDVTDQASLEQLVSRTRAQFGQVHVLVNNVGWTLDRLFLEKPKEEWEKEIRLNLWSTIFTIRAVLPQMVERRYGRVVSLSSDAGRMGEYREAVYSACKAGIIALSKSLARETGRYGITFNTVCPGITVPTSEEMGEQSMWQQMSQIFTPEVQEKAKTRYALQRLGTAQDVANAVAFLASDAANYITGQTLSVSGGYTMM